VFDDFARADAAVRHAYFIDAQVQYFTFKNSLAGNYFFRHVIPLS
jgi:hypothetical protein